MAIELNLMETNTLRKLDREFELDKYSKARRSIDLTIEDKTTPVFVMRHGFGYLAACMYDFHNYTARHDYPSGAFLKLMDRIDEKRNSKASANVLDFPEKELVYEDVKEAA